jgi:hypothetical protein
MRVGIRPEDEITLLPEGPQQLEFFLYPLESGAIQASDEDYSVSESEVDQQLQIALFPADRFLSADSLSATEKAGRSGLKDKARKTVAGVALLAAVKW